MPIALKSCSALRSGKRRWIGIVNLPGAVILPAYLVLKLSAALPLADLLQSIDVSAMDPKTGVN